MSALSPTVDVAPGLPARPLSARHAVPRLAWRSFLDRRRQTLAFGLLFAFVAYIQPVSYRRSYPTAADRAGFAASFARDKAIRLFYGAPHDLLSVGGYTAWRVGGILAIVMAVWAATASAGALSGEEQSGRSELVLSLPVSRGETFAAALVAVAARAIVIAALLFTGLLAAGLPVAGSLLLVAAVSSTVPVYAAIAALASQLVSARRRVVELSMAVLAITFAVRVVADTATGLGWLRWLTPLGWVEQSAPFAHQHPLVLLIPVGFAALLFAAAARIGTHRDLGRGLLDRDDADSGSLRLLGSPIRFAIRGELPSLVIWTGSVGAMAALVGAIADSVSRAGLPPGLRRELSHVTSAPVVTPAGYLGLVFLAFVLVVSLFACSQVAALRAEELGGRLVTLLALPLARRRWLGSRLLAVMGAMATVSLAAGACAWAGARAAGADVGLGEMLLAAVNCWVMGCMFLGIGAVAYALAPRSAVAIAYGLVLVTFLWQLFGGVLGAPSWLIDVSPFAHLGLAPARSFELGAAGVIIGIGLLAGAAACRLLERRDIAIGQ